MKKNNTAWVGISQKKDKKNLSKDSLSGSLISEIERHIKNIKSYKTNLVDFAPTDKTGKLCYPTKIEIDQNFNILWNNIIYKKPKIIFLLGGIVLSAFENNLKIKITKWNNYDYFVTRFNKLTIIPIQHPSYIRVYKKKDTKKYIQNIVNIALRSYIEVV